MKRNNSGSTIIEIIIAMSIFAVFLTASFTVDNNNIKSYLEFVKISKLEGITNDLYAYLYTYKKTYGTSNFRTLITKGDIDGNCNGNDFNGNSDITDSIDEYCFFYPYLNGTNIEFYNGTINNNNADIDSVYLLDNNSDGFDGFSYRSIFSQNNTIITIALKEDTINNDKYSGFIGVYDLNMLGYIYKTKIILE